MRILHSLAAVTVLSTLAAAQSPLCTINPFLSNNGGASGGVVFFDLQVNVSLNLTSLDVSYSPAAGTPVGIQMYTVPGTYVGNEQNMAAWTMVGQDNGSAVAAGLDLPTSIALQSPVQLQPGPIGVAFVAIGAAHRYTDGTGINQTFSTAEMTLNAGAAQHVPFTGATITPRVVNCCLHYVSGPGIASAIPFGDGCGAGDPSSIVEVFDAATNLNDLANTGGLTMIWTGNSYAITPGATPYVAPAGTGNLSLGDDATTMVTLPFPLPSAAGMGSDVWVCSNGWMSFETTTDTGYSESLGAFLGGPTRLAPYWDDLNPTGGGGVFAEPDPAIPAIFHITWENVPEYSATGANTMQISLHTSGVIELKWGPMSSVDGLVGYTTGHGATDPGMTDLSTFNAAVLLGDDRPALGLAVVARPVIGTTGTIETRDIGPAAVAGFLMWGFTQVPAPGFDLGPIGMPGCKQLIIGDAVVPFAPAGAATALHSLAIPNNTALAGVVINAQSVVAEPGINQFGVITSNGVQWTINLN